VADEQRWWDQGDKWDEERVTPVGFSKVLVYIANKHGSNQDSLITDQIRDRFSQEGGERAVKFLKRLDNPTAAIDLLVSSLMSAVTGDNQEVDWS